MPTMNDYLQTASDHINRAVDAMNSKLFGANWKQVSDTCQEVVYAQIEVNRAIHHAEKYIWHDLKKDPLDIPDAGKKVRLALDCATGRKKNVIDGFIGYGDMEWYTMDVGYFRRERSDKDNRVHSAFTVIAWREIEQYETGEV